MKHSKKIAENWFDSFKITILQFLHVCHRIAHETKVTILASFTKWVDPRLEKYRVPKPAEPAPKVPPCTPKSIDEFLEIMKRTPRSVLGQRERHVIASIMNFPSVRVSEIMLPPSVITYVNDDEVLGPLTLDRLYKSGFQHFPVIDNRHRIVGLIHTTALTSLEIKKTSHVREILDPKVCYLREDYTLNQALAAFLRTNCYFFIVVDQFERIVGMLTYQMLIDYLLGETPSDDFDRDFDRFAVSKRKK